MSLIPSESLSFPDDFSRAITRARALSEARATAALLNARTKRPRARATEPPATVAEPVPAPKESRESQPVAVAELPPVEETPVVDIPEAPVEEAIFVQQPALPEPAPIEMLASAPIMPAELPEALPIPEKPIITRPAAVKHLTNRPIVGKAFRVAHQQDFEERPMEPMLGSFAHGLPASRPRAIGKREIPANALSRPQGDHPSPPAPQLLGPIAAPVVPVKAPPKMPAPVLPPAEFFMEPARSFAPKPPSKIVQVLSSLKAPRIRIPKLSIHLSRKWTRFLLAEGIALSVLIPAAGLALSHYFSDPITNFVLNILTIAAAAAAGVVPIVFFAVGPTLPRVER